VILVYPTSQGVTRHLPPPRPHDERSQAVGASWLADIPRTTAIRPRCLPQRPTAACPATWSASAQQAAETKPDLILLHPTDWLQMRKLKTSVNSYVLDPNDPNTLGGIDNLFGIRVVVSTQVPQGNAAVLDSKIAVNIFRRWGLEIMANPYSDTAYEYNQIHYRAETRFALGVVYPEAICLVDLTDAA
jgi:hypothetical protein